MKTTFVILIVQLWDKVSQYLPTLIRLILVFLIISRFYICINYKIETICHCHLMRQNGKEAEKINNAEEIMDAFAEDYFRHK